MFRILSVLLLITSALIAGGGPETTLVVVNARSPGSRYIANEYRVMRGIPASHMLLLDSVPHNGVIPLADFRTKILGPILAYLKAEGLEDRIDLIAYSSDFPYAVDFLKELGGKPSRGVGRQASLTGVTYLYRQVLEDEPFWEILRGANPRETNRYFRIGFASGQQLTAEERNLAVSAAREARENRPAKAAKLYEQFLEKSPDFGRMWVTYAVCLVQLRRVDDAFSALTQAAARGFNQTGMIESNAVLATLSKDERWAPMLEQVRVALKGQRATRGFRSAWAWNGSGEPVEDKTTVHRYMLSVQLAYTGLFGNSIGESIRYLRESAGADATNPDGTVYICKNKDVRSTSREKFFGPLMGALKARGRKVELLENTTIPQGKKDVIGAVVGRATFNWGTSKSVILPGAICEHLTSFGANFATPGQTKLTSFLRFGAAGASGTVVEPLALHFKFPNPMIHAYYADGCSLAEAFYQSVHGPYQLLIVGDGLCQPFAKPPEFKMEFPEQPWTGTVALTPVGEHRFEYWLDGRLLGAGASFAFDTTKYAAGWHDLRVVAVATDRIESRASKSIELVLGAPLVATAVKNEVVYGESIKLKTTGQIEVFYGSKIVSRGPVVPSELVGPGPVRLMVRSGGVTAPVDVTVTMAPGPMGSSQAEARLGLLGTINGTEPILITALGPKAAGPRLRDQLKNRKDIKTLELRGAILAAADGVYQLSVRGTGTVTVRIAGKELVASTAVDSQLFVLRSLTSGWHEIEINYVPKGVPNLEMVVSGGGRGIAPRLGRILPPIVPPEWKADKDGAIVVEFKKRPKQKISGLAVFPSADGDLAREWTIEYRPSTAGRWKPVPAPLVLQAPMSSTPAKGKKAKSIAVEFRFDPVRARQFRLTPKTPSNVKSVVVSSIKGK